MSKKRELLCVMETVCKDDKGALAVLFALIFPVLLGVSALAIDLAHLRLQQDYYHVVADAVAMDVGHDIAAQCSDTDGGCTLDGLQKTAIAEAARMQCQASNGCVISVTWPYNGNDRGAAIRIQGNMNASFLSRVIPLDVQSIVNQNQALDTYANYSSGCFLSMSTMSLSSPSLSTNCEFISNGNMTIKKTDAQAVMTSGQDISVSSDSHVHYTNPQQYRVNSPYVNSEVTRNQVSNLPCQESSGNKYTNLSPGRYCRMVIIVGQKVNFTNGRYYFDNSQRWIADTITLNNATLIFAPNASLSITSSKLNVTAPSANSTVATPGVFLSSYSNDNNNATYNFVNDTWVVSGAMVVPQKTLSFSGGSLSGACAQIIGYAISMSSNTINTSNQCSDSMGVLPFGTQKTGWISTAHANTNNLTTALPQIMEH